MLWLSVQAVVAQDFNILPLPTQNQLPASSIHCLMQDNEGFLWYATEGGLCRDNGYQIDVFRPETSKRSQNAYKVNCMTETGNSNIFFGTADGLFRIDKRTYKTHQVKLDSANHFIETLYMDRQQHLWVGTNGLIFECDEEGEVIKEYPCRISQRPSSVAYFMEDRHGTLYILQWRSGIMRKQKGEKDFTPLQWPLQASPLKMIEDELHHCFWVLTSGAGIQRMTIDGEQCVLEAQPATMGDENRNRALHMLYDQYRGLFWTTTHDDLYAYRLDRNGQLQEFPLTGWFPRGKKILDQMCMDKNGNIYVASYTPHTFIISSPIDNVVKLPIDAIKQQTGYPLLADRSVYDGNQFIWIWQGRQGLMLYDRENERVETVPFQCERTIQRCSLGGIWASNGSAVFRIWQKDGRIQQEEIAQMPEGRHVKCLYEKGRDALYIVADSTLFRLTMTGRHLSKIATMSETACDIDISHDGNIYLALGHDGICKISSKGDVVYMKLPHETFLSVCTMADGSVWTSSYEGNVYRYKPSEGAFVKEELLCSNNQAAIRRIRIDGLGHVWTQTDQEVREYSPLTQAFRSFRNTENAIDVSYFYAIEPISQNKICINGAGALIEVESSAELNTFESAQVHPRITAVLVNGDKRLVGNDAKELALTADEEDITLQLTTLDHLHVSSINFAYKLKGIHDDWILLPQGTNSITLTDLPKGNHKLLVKATGRYGLWSQPVELISIVRAAHWWETWWAYILYYCIAAGICYAIWRVERRIHLLRRLIRRKSEMRLNEIELKRVDIAEQQRDDEFLRRAVTKIEEHLSDTDYNVATLSADLYMSRITLYRHLQEQTGLTPTEFIRDIRLKKAASILSQYPDASVADIARKVGFATPKYFSRCFRDKFGVLPKDYPPNAHIQ